MNVDLIVDCSSMRTNICTANGAEQDNLFIVGHHIWKSRLRWDLREKQLTGMRHHGTNLCIPGMPPVEEEVLPRASSKQIRICLKSFFHPKDLKILQKDFLTKDFIFSFFNLSPKSVDPCSSRHIPSNSADFHFHGSFVYGVTASVECLSPVWVPQELLRSRSVQTELPNAGQRARPFDRDSHEFQ